MVLGLYIVYMGHHLQLSNNIYKDAGKLMDQNDNQFHISIRKTTEPMEFPESFSYKKTINNIFDLTVPYSEITEAYRLKTYVNHQGIAYELGESYKYTSKKYIHRLYMSPLLMLDISDIDKMQNEFGNQLYTTRMGDYMIDIEPSDLLKFDSVWHEIEAIPGFALPKSIPTDFEIKIKR